MITLLRSLYFMGKYIYHMNYDIVMVNFKCQLDWATGYPRMWSNIILGVSVRVFLGKINI